MKATFYGIGYVGLVQAAVLADVGHGVCCVDIHKARIENLKTHAFFDGRNMFEAERMKKKGFAYDSIGRGLSVYFSKSRTSS